MLDIVENLTDKIIGDCKPFLEGLVGEYNVAVCKSGFDVVGECLSYSTLERAHVALVVIRFVLSSHCYSGSQCLTAVSSLSLAIMTPARLEIL